MVVPGEGGEGGGPTDVPAGSRRWSRYTGSTQKGEGREGEMRGEERMGGRERRRNDGNVNVVRGSEM